MRIWPTRDGSITLARLEDLVMVVNRPSVSDRAWEEWVASAVDCYEIGPAAKLFNYSPKWAPSPTQLTGMLRNHMPLLTQFQQFAMVTGSAIVRNAVNAIAWLVPARFALRSYQPERAWRALDWLLEGAGVDPTEARELIARLLAEAGYAVPAPTTGTQLA